MNDRNTLPVPPELLSLACDAVSRRVAPLPFSGGGILISCEVIAAAMECLNDEVTRTLPVKSVSGAGHLIGGLDRCMEKSVDGPAKKRAEVVAGILCDAGIAERKMVLDRRSHSGTGGIRLLPAWRWHIMSVVPAVPDPPVQTFGDNGNELPPWTNLCPVCRSGLLNPVEGQNLFGIRPTGFFLCSLCGAKFVPDQKRFMCVSIAQKKDPAWNRFLNLSYTPDEWSAIARGNRGVGRKKVLPLPKKERHSGEGGLVERCGRLAVPVGGRDLYFTPLKLHFQKGAIVDLFTGHNVVLGNIIRSPVYHNLAGIVEGKYSHYLDQPVGLFLSELKTRSDPFYRCFLHAYGDETFRHFRTRRDTANERRGVFIIVIDRMIRAAGASIISFHHTLNEELGSVSPADCYLDGNSVRCRMNALVSSGQKKARLYAHPVENETDIFRIAGVLDAGTRFPRQHIRIPGMDPGKKDV